MKNLIPVFLVLALAWSIPLQATPWKYKGQFSQPQSSGSLCDAVFAETEYETQHYLTGSLHHTSVVHFVSPTAKGFLHLMTFVGIYGANGDIRAENTFTKDGKYYSIVSEGIVDPRLLVVTVSVEIKDSISGPTVCTAQADYSGFN